MYTQLGVLTKGTVIEVNVSELGMVTAGGKVVFGKYAQVTNNPENDGCINAVLRASHPPFIFRRTILTNSSQLSKPFTALFTPCFHTTSLYRLIVNCQRLNVRHKHGFAFHCRAFRPKFFSKICFHLIILEVIMSTRTPHVLRYQHLPNH